MVRTFSPSVFAASSFFFFFSAVPAASSVASGTHHEPSAMEVVLGTMGVASPLALSTFAWACRRRPCCPMTGVYVMGPAILGCPPAAPQTCLHAKRLIMHTKALGRNCLGSQAPPCCMMTVVCVMGPAILGSAAAVPQTCLCA